MVKNPPAMRETAVRSQGRGRSPGEGNGYPLQYSGLQISVDRGAWLATMHGVTKSQTRPSDAHTHTHTHTHTQISLRAGRASLWKEDA